MQDGGHGMGVTKDHAKAVCVYPKQGVAVEVRTLLHAYDGEENTQLEGGHKEYSLTQTKGGEGRGQGYCFVEYCVGWS